MTKKWTGFLKESYTDADKFNLEFTGSLNNSKKRLSIAALMLVDSLYFEGKKGFFSHFVLAPFIHFIVFVGAVVWFFNYYQTL